MAAIKGIIWDLAGVLLHTPLGGFNEMLAERLGIPLEEVNRVMDTPENTRWDMAEISDDEFYDFVLRELNQPAHKKAMIRKFVVDDFFIDPVLLAYIRGLRVSYTSALLTNFPSHVHEFMRTAWRVDGAFDLMVASCDVKLIKPDARIYHLTLERMNLPAEAVVFIDDRLINVCAAQAVGIRSILYQNRTQVIADLEALLVSAG